jgi:hypothetical protein
MAKRKKVAIVGWAASSRDIAPYKDDSWDIWGCNEFGMFAKDDPLYRWDIWFQLHPRAEMLKHYKDRLEWLAEQTIPVYVMEPFPELPNAVQFPAQELASKYRRYFMSTIAWMVALAIEQGYKEIGIWGVDMAMDSEYSHQKPNCEWILGIAEGKGITVHAPKECALLNGPYLYCVDTLPEEFGPIPESFIRERLQVAQKKREEALSHALRYEGVAMDLDAMLRKTVDWKRRAGLMPAAAPGDNRVESG